MACLPLTEKAKIGLYLFFNIYTVLHHFTLPFYSFFSIFLLPENNSINSVHVLS